MSARAILKISIFRQRVTCGEPSQKDCSLLYQRRNLNKTRLGWLNRRWITHRTAALIFLFDNLRLCSANASSLVFSCLHIGGHLSSASSLQRHDVGVQKGINVTTLLLLQGAWKKIPASCGRARYPDIPDHGLELSKERYHSNYSRPKCEERQISYLCPVFG